MILTFKNFLKEQNILKRVGIQHLDKMKPIDFIALVKFFETELEGKLNTKSVSVTEKIDGSAWKFGVNREGKFYAELSYAGPFYKGSEFAKHAIENNKTNTFRFFEGFGEAFDLLKSTVKINSKEFPNGLRVIGEILYIPLGTETTRGIKWVNIEYDKTKLGKKATFVLLKATDLDGNELPSKVLDDIVKQSTADIKIIKTPKLNIEVNISFEINNFNKLLSNYKDVITLLSSRKKEDKSIKMELQKLIAQYQDIISKKIISMVNAGSLGVSSDDFEGIVLEILKGDFDLLKITSPKFKEYMAVKANK